MIKKQRLPFVILAFLSLIVGLAAGLERLGWNISIPNIGAHHGAIMSGGFIGTLITFEKIIVLKKPSLYAVPLLSGASTILFFCGFPNVAFGLLSLSSIGLVGVFTIFFWKERSVVYALMLAGAFFWLVGNIMVFSTSFYPSAFNWWMVFVLLIITSERLELMKFLPVTSQSKIIFICLILTLATGPFFSFHGPGIAITSLALAGVALWLLRNDIVGITVRKKGLTRFVAVSLISGYVWLLLTASFYVSGSQVPFYYDLVVHSFFIGFVFSMIFAHGPIILPGILGMPGKPYSRLLYVCLAMLHASLIMRVIGDLYLLIDLRRYSGIVTAIAVLSYFAILGSIVMKKQDVSLS